MDSSIASFCLVDEYKLVAVEQRQAKVRQWCRTLIDALLGCIQEPFRVGAFVSRWQPSEYPQIGKGDGGGVLSDFTGHSRIKLLSDLKCE